MFWKVEPGLLGGGWPVLRMTEAITDVECADDNTFGGIATASSVSLLMLTIVLIKTLSGGLRTPHS
jgi:hypothetical protein